MADPQHSERHQYGGTEQTPRLREVGHPGHPVPKEELAQKIIDKGTEEILERTQAQEEGGDVATPAMQAVPSSDPVAVANKVIKLGAQKLEREEAKPHADGSMFKGSLGAQAESVRMSRNNPKSEMYDVAETVRHRFEQVQSKEAGHKTFVGPNPASQDVHPNMKERKGRNFGYSMTKDGVARGSYE